MAWPDRVALRQTCGVELCRWSSSGCHANSYVGDRREGAGGGGSRSKAERGEGVGTPGLGIHS